ncbi:Fic family protein [Duganella phyllosphaerae]|uniref:Fic/DOC family protein n=1 Tax=Duganella phyllosphaerae TaxID=762836 RepID=A0A1E7X428_9BURK|nr:Fic family protein [Duganella phyllosphaerae]OFA07236.1 Fic/DOC family protein [Duganella phyllosphaerae]
MNFDELDALKAKLNALRPLPAAALRNLHDELVLRWTYNSNAIEGNTLTLMETKVVLEGITIGGKLLREHFDAINHRDAILYVEDVVLKAEPLSEWQIRNLHRLVLKHVDDDNAGIYRKLNVTIAGARHVPPDMLLVPEQMAALMHWYDNEATAVHPVVRAAKLHVDFVKIYPFVDGNGRTARLLLNLELLKGGFPAIVLPVTRRLAYYEALDTAHMDGDLGPFIELVVECVREGFAPYWHILGIAPAK